MSPWLHRFSWVAAGATFCLIVIGALVTGLGVGLAVPDWPTTFGNNMFSYDWFRSEGGVFVEHGHRLAGSVVGLLTLALAVWIWVAEKRPWVRGLGVIALFAVIVQGVMGGLRVVQISETWALIHGAFAQAFFALMSSFVILTSPSWGSTQREANPEAKSLRRLSLSTALMLYLQVVLGSFVRHSGAGVEWHLLLALAVFVHILLLVKKTFSSGMFRTPLTKLSGILAGLALLQLLLGFASWALTSQKEAGIVVRGHTLQVLVTTLHVGVGALMLAFSVCFALLVRRYAPEEAQP